MIGNMLLTTPCFLGLPAPLPGFYLFEHLLAYRLVIRHDFLKQKYLTTTYRATGSLPEAYLHSLASSVILAHNHPSGNLTPSIADIETTKQIKAALNLIDVKLHDHFIITVHGWSSLYAQGVL